jgi:hypothetical protein
MNKILSAFLIGAVFGIGIAISGMANPAKVLNFFDIAGTWDPSLLFVMGGALVTAAIGYRVLFGARQKPVFETGYALPTSRRIDAELARTQPWQSRALHLALRLADAIIDVGLRGLPDLDQPSIGGRRIIGRPRIDAQTALGLRQQDFVDGGLTSRASSTTSSKT